jgi:hypothetical protein
MKDKPPEKIFLDWDKPKLWERILARQKLDSLAEQLGWDKKDKENKERECK